VKKQYLIALGLLCIANAAYSADSNEPDKKTITTLLEKHLQAHGDFCLGKFDWPIDVSEAEFGQKTRDALQMPVLEKLGLVTVSSAEAMRKIDDKELSVPVKRYNLTDAGKKFYLEKESVTIAAGQPVSHNHDLCVGKLSLDKIINLTKKDNDNLLVHYTYKIKAAKWANDADVQRVFPLMAHIVKGGGQVKLEQPFRLEGNVWKPLTHLD
jgi:hypothetical protein